MTYRLALTALRRGIAALCVLSSVAGCSGGPPTDADAVVLVHGLGRTAASMSVLGLRISDEGYRVVPFDYPSTTETLDVLVDSLAAEVDRCCAVAGERVHFVTHSMGGVLVRAYLDRHGADFEGHVVMLAPPNQGSELIDAFRDSDLLQTFLGPAGMQLGTDSAGVAASLGPVDFSLGIIAGNQSLNPLGSWLIPGDDDGKVSVERARIPGAVDFIVIPATHTFIMNRGDVAREVVHFLREGTFVQASR